MIQITPKCAHATLDRLKGIVMRVVAGDITPDTAIVCPYCNRILFYVEEMDEEPAKEVANSRRR